MNGFLNMSELFESVAPSYDFLNCVLSFFKDMGWRKQLIRRLPQKDNLTVLDIATGTGEIPILARREKNRSTWVGIDICQGMLRLAHKKQNDLGDSSLNFICADAHRLMFQNNSFDAVTIAFGIRNMSNISMVLNEVRRVLRPNGKLLILEFSLPDNPVIRAGYLFYLWLGVSVIGGMISGNVQAYTYLCKSIQKFPSTTRFCQILTEHGFKVHQVTPLTLGIVTLYEAHNC